MSYSITKQGNNVTAYLKEFIVDMQSDIDTLPTFPKCAIGSSCLVLETSDVYMLGNDNQWHVV